MRSSYSSSFSGIVVRVRGDVAGDVVEEVAEVVVGEGGGDDEEGPVVDVGSPDAASPPFSPASPFSPFSPPSLAAPSAVLLLVVGEVPLLFSS